MKERLFLITCKKIWNDLTTVRHLELDWGREKFNYPVWLKANSEIPRQHCCLVLRMHNDARLMPRRELRIFERTYAPLISCVDWDESRRTVSVRPFGNGKVRASHAYIVQFLLVPEIALMVLAELRASIGRWLTSRSVIPLSTRFAWRTHLLRVTCGTHAPKSQKWRPRREALLRVFG